MNGTIRFVYGLRSVNHPSRYYIGLTSDVAHRVTLHNEGSQHTRELCPWQLVTSLEFSDESSAIAFEKYLKTGSGRAFAKRHFL
jgi:putative endonuclease